MPVAVFKAVRGVSSEDPIHCAENLLKQQPGKKWKTKTGGEKSAYVILEMDIAHQITGIDIGNEHSAFVEVLVGQAVCSPEDFTEILITCSFMTPFESKKSECVNRVRCFDREALVPTAAQSNKWQMVKIICTQPFNKHVQYGLSFIKVHVADSSAPKTSGPTCFVPEKSGVGETPSKRQTFGLGRYVLQEEPIESELESKMALFNRWKMSRNSGGSDLAPSTAAAIRQASTIAGLRQLQDSVSKPKSAANIATSGAKDKDDNEVLDRNRKELLFGADDESDSSESAKTRRLEKQIEADKERLRIENEKLMKQNESKKGRESKDKSPMPNDTRRGYSTKESNGSPSKHSKRSTEAQVSHHIQKPKDSPSKHSNKRRSSPHARVSKKTKSEIKYRPFNELLKGVTLVVSGIQNPDRSDLRNKALAMGAKYKGDWGHGCTHLICAFKNTPKYNQVRGKGKIVTRSWIEKCFSLRKYLPWRRYALDSADADKEESDEEISDESLKPVSEDEPCPLSSKTRTDPQLDTSNLEGYISDEQVRSVQKIEVSSESDTEDELDRIRKNNSEKSNKENKLGELNTSKLPDVFEVTTEEEDYLKEKQTIIKQFFKNQLFHIAAHIGEVERKKLKSYIKHYGGILTQNMEEADYIISDKFLTESKASPLTVQTVKPSWIYECNDMESKVPMTPYLV